MKKLSWINSSNAIVWPSGERQKTRFRRASRFPLAPSAVSRFHPLTRRRIRRSPRTFQGRAWHRPIRLSGTVTQRTLGASERVVTDSSEPHL